MSLSDFRPGTWLYDRRTGAQRLLQAVEIYGQVVFLSFKHPQSGAVERQPFALAEAVVAAVHAAIARGLLVEADERHTLSTAANPLSVRLRRPAAVLLAEAVLDPAALQKLAERVEQLLLAAPELAFTFRVAVSAEGQRPDAETLARLNALLSEVQAGWRFA